LLKVEQPLDADAAYLLGKIYEEKNDPKTAESFYQEVLTGHRESPVATPSLMGRGICRLETGEPGSRPDGSARSDHPTAG
jgi:hypothetical protein